MKQTLFVAACIALFALTLSSCKKEDTTNDNTNPPSKVKTASKGNYRREYTFDAEDRITLLQYVYIPTNTNAKKFTYSYTSAILTLSEYDSASTVAHETTVYHLDSEGRIIDNSVDQTYAYNAEGYRVTSTDTFFGGMVGTYEYVDGNRVKETYVYPSISHTVVNTMTYYTDKLESRYFGFSFNGEGNKNLLDSRTDGPEIISWTEVYSYKFDEQGRVTKEITNHGDVTVYTYY